MEWFGKIFGVSKNRKTFRVTNIDSILDTDDIYRSMIELHHIITEACNYGDSLEILSEPQRNFYLVQTLMTKVNHGGFDSFFFHSYGDHTYETLMALKEIGAKEIEKVLLQAVREFPNEAVPTELGVREDLLIDEGLSEKAEESWNRLDVILQREITEDVDALCFRYVSDHRESF